MCLGVPGKIIKISNHQQQTAIADVCGVQREINISLICDHNLQDVIGKWVLIHVGFAMSIIDENAAKQTQEALIAMSQLEHEVGDFLGLNQR